MYACICELKLNFFYSGCVYFKTFAFAIANIMKFDKDSYSLFFLSKKEQKMDHILLKIQN